MSSQDQFKNAAKEMELLLKIEGGVDPAKRNMPKNLASEMAAKVARPQGKGASALDREAAGKVAMRGKGAPPIPGGEAAAPLGGGAGTGGNDFLGSFSIPELNLSGGVGDEDSLIKSLTQRSGFEFKSLAQFDLTNEAKMKRLISFIPAQTARDKRVFPIDELRPERGRPTLMVAIFDPLNITILDDIRLMLPEHDVEGVVVAEDEIVDAINRFYGVGEESIESVVEGLQDDQKSKDDQILTRGNEVEINVEALAEAPPVIRLVNLLMMTAIQDNASDLHIEPFNNQLRIRYRVDGVLREIPPPPKQIQLGLMSRIKVMASLNISETRTPQDGRIKLSIGGREIDMRVAVTPTVHGEAIAMRILDKTNMLIGISQLGMQQEVLAQFLKICDRPNGIVLVTGPTGCGKTTTLYSALTETYDPGSKFITTEDPVEYELPGIVQVNVNPAVGLTFAACLRAILRQDPDVILVGEIRDVETAQISIQAALTGHLVFSTLHTNSAAATVTRLVDMGIEPFLLTSTLQVVVGQRLVRTICPRCKTPYIPTDEELEDFGVARSEVSEIVFYHGRGCDECNMSGYRGRIGIYEVLPISEQIREMILARQTSDEINAMGVHEGMMTMRQDGWLKICYGITTFEEVNRQTHPETEESIIQERESVRRTLEKIAAVRRQREAEDAGVDAESGHSEPPPPGLDLGGGH